MRSGKRKCLSLAQLSGPSSLDFDLQDTIGNSMINILLPLHLIVKILLLMVLIDISKKLTS